MRNVTEHTEDHSEFPIPGHHRHYVSTRGTITRHNDDGTESIIACTMHAGELCVQLSGKLMRPVWRLIWELSTGETSTNVKVRYRNGNPSDCHCDNLRFTYTDEKTGFNWRLISKESWLSDVPIIKL